MTTSKKAPKKSKKSKNQFVKFANFYLTKTDKEAISKHLFTAEKAYEFIAEMVEAGYAFKAAWDEKSECPVVMLSGEWTTDFNQGVIMTARHSDLLKGITILYYQHVHLSQSEEWDKTDADPFTNDW